MRYDIEFDKNPKGGLAWGTVAVTASFLLGAVAIAANGPETAEVLGKLHQANLKEIEMGKLAKKNGEAKEVKAYGETLVKDHTNADKKVTALAKQEKIDLPAAKPEVDPDMAKMTGASFDTHFAKEMLDDHKRDVAEATKARDSTTDQRLKKLLTDLVPVLAKHQDIAQKLVDAKHPSASN